MNPLLLVIQFVLPPEIAARLAWDMTGEAGGYFSEMCDMDRLADDDA
jgi:hypothetical protein